jgi:hypothetical protein
MVKIARLALLTVAALAVSFNGAASGAATIIHPTISIALNHSTITLGSTVTVSGAVSPNQHGHNVHLQRYYSGAWHESLAMHLSSTSRYSFSARPSAALVYKYRVYDYAEAGWTAGASATVTVTVKQSCTPGYRPCIPPGSDVDCAGGSGNGPRYVQGPVYVTGPDIYGLDRDGDGVACES